MSAKTQEKDTALETRLVTTPIAIVGMASIFPKARTTREYWDNILQKIDCVTDVPASRWSTEDYYDPDPSKPDKTYCKRGGFIPDVEFDPVEFGLPPNILEVTDVSQLLSLVVAKEALEDAGYSVPGSTSEGRDFDRENTGVVLGVVGISSKLLHPLMSRLQYPIWKKAMLSSGLSETDADAIVEKIKTGYVGWEENSFPGTIVNVIAGRIANRFDLGATNCVVDAACGSSLAAIRTAVAELIEGRANMMITGGVDTDNSIGTYLCFSKTPAFSKGQSVRTFDEDSDGMLVGEGIGMLVLKRLADAERDGDRIYAVIKAIGSSSDGRFKSIYAPRPVGQAKALRRAYAEAGFAPQTIGLVEAHGTGTPAGDPAEVESLREVFTSDNLVKNSIALGSVKSQIAHTKAAAGAASLIKTALALYHQVLPPTINVKKINPKLGLENSPFYVNTEARPWMRSANQPPRRAAVSSFGFGGTNFHLVLEEYSSATAARDTRLQSVDHRLLLHAETPGKLAETAHQVLDNLQGETGASHLATWAQNSRSIKIPADHARFGLVARDLGEAVELLSLAVTTLQEKATLDSWEHPRGIYYRKTGLETRGKVVALFAGQGSQYVSMGRELSLNFPEVRGAFETADQQFVADSQPPLTTRVFPVPVFEASDLERQAEEITRTEFAQPAIGAFSVGQYRLLTAAGFRPDFTAGHSFGELTALWAAGVLDDAAYFSLARARGKAMAPPSDSNFDAGTMLAVKGDVAKLKEKIQAMPGITLANHNSNEQVVLAGSKTDIAEAQKALSAAGFSTIPLSVSAAFHTPLVGHAQKPFAAAIGKQEFTSPKIPVFSNSTGKQHPQDPEKIRQALANHILKPVLYRDEIESIYAEGGRIFVEFGPKNIQANLVKATLGDREHIALSINPNAKKDSDRQFREAVVQLQVAGVELSDVDPYEKALPTEPPKKKSSAMVVLNGGFYTSEKTRAGFDKALANGHTVHLNGSKPQLDSLQTTGLSEDPPQKAAVVSAAPRPPAIQPNIPGQISSSALDLLMEHQNATLRVHTQYMQNQGEYARTFTELVRLGYSALNGAGSGEQAGQAARVVESIERSLDRFQDYQADTLKVHQEFLNSQMAFGRGLFELVQGLPLDPPALQAAWQPAPVANPVEESPVVQIVSSVQTPAQVAGPMPGLVSEPEEPVAVAVPAATGSAHSVEILTAALLGIVSEKTGYPTEMLDTAMDMEADLGIDSIKRVEILGAMQAQFPELPKIDSTALSETRSLGQVVDLMRAQSGSTGETPVTEEIIPAVAPAPTGQPSQTGLDTSQISQALLAVVAEKTGYPAEMLEMEMDMEADLGIDSIKRVEILGAMQTRFPDLPKADSAALADLRTLRQILDLLAAAPSAPASQESGPDPVGEPSTVAGLTTSGLSIQTLPAPDHLEYEFPQDHVMLVHDDGTSLTDAVVDALTQRGWKAAVVRVSETLSKLAQSRKNNLPTVHLESVTETGVESMLKEIQKKYGQIGGYIHLHPGLEDGKGKLLSATSEKLVEMAFLTAKHLKATLNQASTKGRSMFLTVTRQDGQLGLGGAGSPDPVAGGLFGLVKSLAREWDAVYCRGIDLAPDLDVKKAVEAILAEIDDPNRLVSEVGYGPRGRVTAVVQPLPSGD